MRYITRRVLTALAVLFAIGAVGACILWLLGYGGAWRLVRYDSILSSLFKYVIVGGCAFVIYHFARVAVMVESRGKSRPWPPWLYLRCVLASGVIGFIAGATLGTYVKDAAPLRGGGVIIANYAPDNAQRATAALEVFLGVLLPGITGTRSGVLEAEKKLKR